MRPSTTAVAARAGEHPIGGRSAVERSPCRRDGWCRCSSGIDTVTSSRVASDEVVAGGEEEQVGEAGAEHEVRALVETHRRAHRAVGQPGQELGLLRVGAARGDHRRRPHRGQERAGRDDARPAPRPRAPARRARTRSRRAPRAGAGPASRGRPSPSTPRGASPRVRRAACGPRRARRCGRGRPRRRCSARGGRRRSRCPWVLQDRGRTRPIRTRQPMRCSGAVPEGGTAERHRQLRARASAPGTVPPRAPARPGPGARACAARRRTRRRAARPRGRDRASSSPRCSARRTAPSTYELDTASAQ